MACSFMNYFEKMVALHLDRPINGAQIIDYGCGWGRLTRFLIKHTPIAHPGARSRRGGAGILEGPVLEGTARQIPRHPSDPRGERAAHVAFLFSILTHTPPKLTTEISNWLTRVLAPGGLLIFTIRPKSYWNHHAKGAPSTIQAARPTRLRLCRSRNWQRRVRRLFLHGRKYSWVLSKLRGDRSNVCYHRSTPNVLYAPTELGCFSPRLSSTRTTIRTLSFGLASTPMVSHACSMSPLTLRAFWRLADTVQSRRT